MDTATAENLLILVPSDEAPSIWPKVEHYLQAANNFAGGKFHMKHMLMKVLADQADLWVHPMMRSALLAESVQFPAARIYMVIYAGSDGGDDWPAYERQIEARARDLRCDAIENWGRPGWKRIGEQCGYHIAHYVYRKEL